MSPPVSRKHATPLPVQHRTKPNTSGKVPSSIQEFKTQEPYDPDGGAPPDDSSAGVIEDSQPSVSGRHRVTASQPSRTMASSHRSDERTEQAENSRQRHSSHNSLIPQATDPKGRSSHNEPRGKQAATEVSTALDNCPPPKVLAALRRMLDLWAKTKDFPDKVVHKEVIQVITTHFPDLKRDQSEPIQSQPRTTGLNVETTRRLSAPNNETSALVLEDTHGSQHGSQHGSRSSRDAAGAPSLHRDRSASIVITPGRGDPNERVAAVPTIERGKTKAAPKPLLKHMQQTIDSEEEFRDIFLDWNLSSIQTDGLRIDLLALARETVEGAEPIFEQRLQGGSGGKRVNRTRRANITKEIWQVLFTVIANIFVFGLEPLFENVDAASKPTVATRCSGQGRPSPTDTATDSIENNGRVTGESGNGGPGHTSAGTLLGPEDLSKMRLGMRNMHSRKNPAQIKLNRVYDYYDDIQTVILYDSMLESWEKHKADIERALREEFENYKGQDAATVILSWVAQEKETLGNDMKFLDKDSKDIVDLSTMISALRPICSLVEAFGQGVLLLLVKNAEKFALGKLETSFQKQYPQHERIRDVAMSLCKVDREIYEGNLCQQFARLKEKVLRPILQFREGGDTRKLLLDCPQKKIFDEVDIGERISYILTCVDRRHGARSDVRTVQGGASRDKRIMPHRNREEAGDGDQGRSKRRRTESIEDEESCAGESES